MSDFKGINYPSFQVDDVQIVDQSIRHIWTHILLHLCGQLLRIRFDLVYANTVLFGQFCFPMGSGYEKNCFKFIGVRCTGFV